jgi:hypothetical protein
MKKSSIERMVERVRAKSYGRRSDAYRWLRENYEPISRVLAQARPSWRVIADAVAAEGVTGARGQRMAAEDLRQMWQRVCRDVKRAEAEASRAAKMLKPVPARPSRSLPPDWTPPLADPPPPARSRPAPALPPSPDDPDYCPEDDMNLEPEVREAFRNLREDLEYRDRHL